MNTLSKLQRNTVNQHDSWPWLISLENSYKIRASEVTGHRLAWNSHWGAMPGARPSKCLDRSANLGSRKLENFQNCRLSTRGPFLILRSLGSWQLGLIPASCLKGQHFRLWIPLVFSAFSQTSKYFSISQDISLAVAIWWTSSVILVGIPVLSTSTTSCVAVSALQTPPNCTP